MAQLPALPNLELEKQALEAMARYAGEVAETYPPDQALLILRENLRGLSLAFGELAGHDVAAEFMELMAVKQRTFAGYERGYIAFKGCETATVTLPSLPSIYTDAPDNVVQFSERFRNSRKATT